MEGFLFVNIQSQDSALFASSLLEKVDNVVVTKSQDYKTVVVLPANDHDIINSDLCCGWDAAIAAILAHFQAQGHDYRVFGQSVNPGDELFCYRHTTIEG